MHINRFINFIRLLYYTEEIFALCVRTRMFKKILFFSFDQQAVADDNIHYKKDSRDNLFSTFQKICSDLVNESSYTGKTEILHRLFFKASTKKKNMLKHPLASRKHHHPLPFIKSIYILRRLYMKF